MSSHFKINALLISLCPWYNYMHGNKGFSIYTSNFTFYLHDLYIIITLYFDISLCYFRLLMCDLLFTAGLVIKYVLKPKGGSTVLNTSIALAWLPLWSGRCMVAALSGINYKYMYMLIDKYVLTLGVKYYLIICF